MTELCILTGVLTCLAITDLRKQTIRVDFVMISAAVGIVLYVLGKPFSALSLAGGVTIGGVLLAVSLLSKEKIGIGDGLVFCMTGIFLGIRGNFTLLMLSSVLAAAVSGILILLRRYRRDDRIPFLPFVLGADIAMIIMGVISQ